jgi:hypothetical protein
MVDCNKPKRESVDFGPCASPPYRSRKVFSSKTSLESGLPKSKVITKHLAKSIAKVSNSLPVAFVSISKAYSELIEGDQFTDINKTVVTYVLDVFKCPDGYMSSQIYKEVIKIPGWSIPIAILCALVFTFVINSYCPMLISMLPSLNRILKETLGIAKAVEKIQDNQEHSVELISILSAKQSSVSKPISSSDSSSCNAKKSDNSYCLWFWVIICIFCGFLAALFIAAVFLSLIISLIDPVLEPEKIERQLSNNDSSSTAWCVSSAAASIINQDEFGTTLIMPCEGIALDEVGNEYQIDGSYKLVCNPPVAFNYVTSVVTWYTDHCCTVLNGNMIKELMVIVLLKLMVVHSFVIIFANLLL